MFYLTETRVRFSIVDELLRAEPGKWQSPAIPGGISLPCSRATSSSFDSPLRYQTITSPGRANCSLHAKCSRRTLFDQWETIAERDCKVPSGLSPENHLNCRILFPQILRIRPFAYFFSLYTETNSLKCYEAIQKTQIEFVVLQKRKCFDCNATPEV